MENNIYDLAILGAGPAGICAAIYATRAKLNTIWLDRKFVQGGQIVDTYEVDNYPGLPGITGLDLGEAMADNTVSIYVYYPIISSLHSVVKSRTGQTRERSR